MTAKPSIEYFPAPRRSLFCSQCGTPVNRRVPEGDNRERDICDHCGAIHYQNPRLVVGTVPVWENRILLCRRAIEPRYNTWTLPAGFMELGESTALGAARETLEESGARIQLGELYTLIDLPQIDQVHVFYLAQALGPELDPGPESLEARWYDEAEIPWDDLAFRTVATTLRHYFEDRKQGVFVPPPLHPRIAPLKLPWLAADTPFPPAEFALTDPDGLLAAGADLSQERLIQAYSNGIFPWYSEGEPVLWWSPDPRMVLEVKEFSPSHSLRKLLRQIASQEHDASPRVQVRVDTVFPQVMAHCAAPRDGQPGTWITSAMQQAYAGWHQAGYVHSIETWIDGELAGGLYGISLGRMFFGESMFTRVPNASKIALAYLVRYLSGHGVQCIDCQQQTRHLASLGARPIARTRFLQHVRQRRAEAPIPWTRGVLDSGGRLLPDAASDADLGVNM